MYKLSQLTEDGSIMLHGQKIADTILYVNGDFVKIWMQDLLIYICVYR